MKCIEEVIEALKNRFEVKLIPFDIKPAPYKKTRDDVTVAFQSSGDDTELNYRNIRDWLIKRDWLFSVQQRTRPLSDSKIVDYLLCPANFIKKELKVGFHATPRCNVESIKEIGLEPGTPERQNTTNRIDCIGNIYICEKLGKPEDADRQGSDSAYWWRHELANNKHNKAKNTDWVILEIDLEKCPPCRLVQDVWSESGIVVFDLPKIPPECISQIKMEQN